MVIIKNTKKENWLCRRNPNCKSKPRDLSKKCQKCNLFHPDRIYTV